MEHVYTSPYVLFHFWSLPMKKICNFYIPLLILNLTFGRPLAAKQYGICLLLSLYCVSLQVALCKNVWNMCLSLYIVSHFQALSCKKRWNTYILPKFGTLGLCPAKKNCMKHIHPSNVASQFWPLSVKLYTTSTSSYTKSHFGSLYSMQHFFTYIESLLFALCKKISIIYNPLKFRTLGLNRPSAGQKLEAPCT